MRYLLLCIWGIFLLGLSAQDTPSLSDATFKTTHNSYSGGTRGTILQQLEQGVRGIEFDFHDNDVEKYGFRIGHWWPGSEVDHSDANPDSDALEDWLTVISHWSQLHPGHSPITIFLDIKDNLTDNPTSFGLVYLNALVEKIFPHRLFRPVHLSGNNWPSADTLQNRILVVLTGDSLTKLAYLREIPDLEKSCFVDYTYKNDSNSELLDKAQIINIKFSHLVNNQEAQKWLQTYHLKNKLVRLYSYDSSWGKEPKQQWPQVFANFPATDHPYEDWYIDDYKYVANFLGK